MNLHFILVVKTFFYLVLVLSRYLFVFYMCLLKI